MAHFAKIENGIVTNVIVVNNETLENLEFPESESVGQEFIASLGFDGVWKQTSYNGNFRVNYAGIGHSYDEDNDVFIAPKPYESWILNEETYQWDPPLEYPNDGNSYLWNENALEWKMIENG